MNQKHDQPPNSRIDYRWRVDREQGFDRASFLYDANGRLRAIDYPPVRSPKREEVKPAR